MKGQIITVALILLGHTFLTPAVQAIGFDYYNDHGVMSNGKGYWWDKKIISEDEQSRFAPCDKYIRGAGVGGRLYTHR